LRITYLYQYFGTPAGSWSTRVYELSRRWVEAGHQVTVITAPYKKSDIKINKFINVQQFDGIKVIIINSGDNNLLPIWRRALNALVFALVSSFYHLKIKADITIASSGPITIGIPALIGKWLARKRYVFEIRDLWPAGAVELGLIRSKWLVSLGYYFERKCYNHSILLVPCSDGMDRNIKLRFPNIDTLVIPNACDIELFNRDADFKFPNWYNPLKVTFIYAGSIGLMDACIEIVYGVNESKFKDLIQVVIIGNGSEENFLKSEIARFGLDDQIKVIGLMPKVELVAWYRVAKASFVLFKNYETLSTSSPNKLFDSLAAGVPIVQNTDGWIKDLLEIYNCGLSVKPNNCYSFASAIDRIIQDPQLADTMGERSKKLAFEKFNREQLSNIYLNKLIDLSR